MTVRLLTTEEVADRFRTSPATVRYWRHIGIGPRRGARRPPRALRRGRVRPVVADEGQARGASHVRVSLHGGCQGSRAGCSNAWPSEA